MNSIPNLPHRVESSFSYSNVLTSPLENGVYDYERGLVNQPRDRGTPRVNGMMPISYSSFHQPADQHLVYQQHGRFMQQTQNHHNQGYFHPIQTNPQIFYQHHIHHIPQLPTYFSEQIATIEQYSKEKESMARDSILRTNKISISVIKKSGKSIDTGCQEKITTVFSRDASFYKDVQKINEISSKSSTVGKVSVPVTKKSRKRNLNYEEARNTSGIQPASAPLSHTQY